MFEEIKRDLHDSHFLGSSGDKTKDRRGGGKVSVF